MDTATRVGIFLWPHATMWVRLHLTNKQRRRRACRAATMPCTSLLGRVALATGSVSTAMIER